MTHKVRFGPIIALICALTPFLSQARTPQAPALRTDVSAELNEYNLSVSGDDRTMAFARSQLDFAGSRIFVAERSGPGWSKPRLADFSDARWRDSDPWVTPDGGTMYFVSDRPTPARPDKRDLDIWRSERRAGRWQAPEHLGDVVNGRGEELGPELHDGELYFATARKSGLGGLDIYSAAARGTGFAQPQLLRAPINSAASESDFTLSRDGQTALFWRQVGARGLLHMSRRRADGDWSEPEALPDSVNIGPFNFTPAFGRNGAITFASTRPREGQAEGMADVYQVDLPRPGTQARSLDTSAVAAIEAVAYDYVDGQLEGDAKRVARALHPDLAKRAVVGDWPTAREMFPLRRMSADELVQLTADGSLRTPREKWVRSVEVLDIAGNAAVARVETPWFVDHFHLGRFGDRWLIINALWWSKPQPQTPGK
ncbi:MAG TPA: nuclear transport factor 2 family protein [Sphingomonadaceae bacterium]|jgi:hypothetical protein|nr:nuclear transport factor 2 family protein [Sphingomonadaceae bacterium]